MKNKTPDEESHGSATTLLCEKVANFQHAPFKKSLVVLYAKAWVEKEQLHRGGCFEAPNKRRNADGKRADFREHP